MVTTDEYRHLLARQMSEAELQAAVMSRATELGYLAYHPPDNRPVTARSGRRYVQGVRAGFPDVCAVRGPRLLFAELKREGQYPKPEQREWRDRLVAAGAEWYLWRPSDLLSGLIDDILRRPTR